jgi:hypothetical protein
MSYGHCDLSVQVWLKYFLVLNSGCICVTSWSKKVRRTPRGFLQAKPKILSRVAKSRGFCMKLKRKFAV